MTRKSPEISDREYVNSHRVKPKGLGWWSFLMMDDSSTPALRHGSLFAPGAMTFGDAKVWAKAHVRERFAAELQTGHLYLEVAP